MKIGILGGTFNPTSYASYNPATNGVRSNRLIGLLWREREELLGPPDPGRLGHGADFGLLLAESFELEPEEREFLRRHIDYDFGEVLASLAGQLLWQFSHLAEPEQSRVREAMGLHGMEIGTGFNHAVVAGIEQFNELAPLAPGLLTAVKRYRAVMLFELAFFRDLRANPKKDTLFDGEELRRLLIEAGVPV